MADGPTIERTGAGRRNLVLAGVFLTPAALLLGALVIYPIFYTVVRSLYDAGGDSFVGVDNYVEMFESDRTRRAVRNNFLWVVFAPTIATGIGLIFAVLAERVRWQTAFKVAVFMPMAISGLATGVIFRLVYEADADRGLANAVLTTANDLFDSSGQYAGARPSVDEALTVGPDGAMASTEELTTGRSTAIGLVAIRPANVPDRAEEARVPDVGGDAIGGVVYLDFSRGGTGERGRLDPGEQGLPGVEVLVRRGGEVVGSARTADDGSFVVDGLEPGPYQLGLAASNFRETFNGVNWLGADLVTPSIMASWLWIWIGFAMIVIGAGLSAIPRDVLEAARVDGANEWQVFRQVTAPLLLPVLLVVLVTLVINVLKIFDLVLVIAPGSVQDEANVIALEQWRQAFGVGDPGMGSALAVLLFVLVLPAMAFNVRRFRSEDR